MYFGANKHLVHLVNLLSVSSKKEEQTSTLHLNVFQFYVFGLCLDFTVCWRYAKKKGQNTGDTQKKLLQNSLRLHLYLKALTV